MKIASIILALAACSTLMACREDRYDNGSNYSRTGTGSVDTVRPDQSHGGSR